MVPTELYAALGRRLVAVLAEDESLDPVRATDDVAVPAPGTLAYRCNVSPGRAAVS
jgi:hypothetical protein